MNGSLADNNGRKEWEIGSKEAICGAGEGCEIHCRDIRFGYGSNIALSDIDLTISQGEFVTMCGPSGCGKTTFLNILNGEKKPQKGIVMFDGKPKTRPDADCGMVGQKYGVFPHLTALQNVIAGPLFSKTGIIEGIIKTPHYRFTRKQVIEEAMEIMKVMGLEKELHKYPTQLSGGQQQRLAIAQVIIMKPKVLLMDEPFTGLDPATKESIAYYISKMWLAAEKKMTVICATHDLPYALKLGTRIIAISQHYVTAKGPGVGARIVADLPITAPHPRGLDFEKSSEYQETKEIIIKTAFGYQGEGVIVPVNAFILRHPDSFQTTELDELPKENLVESSLPQEFRG
jgi:NitT/TauT family transport system ATP-binding protein